MKKKGLSFGMLAMVLALGMLVTGCGDTGDPDDGTLTSTSADASGNTYTLTVTPKADKAAYVAKIGDSYVLTIQPSSGTTKISRGTVKSNNGSYLELQPSGETTTFIIVIIDGSMIAISGTITLEDGATVPAPTLVQGGGNTDPKSITITGLSGQTGQIEVALGWDISYNAWVSGGPEGGGESGHEFLGDTANGVGTISGDSVTVALKKDDNTAWTGSGYYFLEILINDNLLFGYKNGNSNGLTAIKITGATTTVAFNKFMSGQEN
jgi:hypothetical protein